MADKIKWNRSQDGFTTSKCGRFSINPIFRGCERPNGFVAKDLETGKSLPERDTQRDAKSEAEILLGFEASKSK
jgi:hypothetical protein